jgi:hypothetical protein
LGASSWARWVFADPNNSRHDVMACSLANTKATAGPLTVNHNRWISSKPHHKVDECVVKGLRCIIAVKSHGLFAGKDKRLLLDNLEEILANHILDFVNVTERIGLDER